MMTRATLLVGELGEASLAPTVDLKTTIWLEAGNN